MGTPSDRRGKKWVSSVGGLALFGLVTSLAACTNAAAPANSSGTSSTANTSAQPYEIAFIGDLTGVAQSGGTSSQAGFMAAVANINSAGGINGHPINVTTYDAQSTTNTASAVTIDAVGKKPTMIFDAVQSSEVAATASTLQGAGIPSIMIALSSDLLGPPPAAWYYLLTPDANQTATEVVNGAKAVLGGSLAGKKIALDEYGTPAVADYVTSLKSQLAAENATVVVDITDPAGSLLTSWSSQAAQVANANPDVLVMFPNPSNMPVTMSALATAGVTVPIVASEGGSDEATVAKVASPQLNVVRSSTPTDLLRQSADTAGFGSTANGVYSGKGWIGAYIMQGALQKCTYPCSPKDIETNLESGDLTVPGNVALGPIRFTNTQHVGVSMASLFRWDESKQAGVPYGSPFAVGPQ
jgi:branched-chain amino acid transport system substrate-binding protein